jgi:NAD(P)-dependent dehydrogenase (short-subunit alcohol dehydrogenase family)
LEISNLFDLTGKTALITGGGSGIGRAIAEAMGQQGATVIIAGIDEATCIEATIIFSAKKISSFYICCDIAKTEDIKRLYAEALKQTGRIDILVNCAGIAITGSQLNFSDAEYEKIAAINIKAAILLSKLVLPDMVQRKDGVLIFLASIAGVRGNKSLGLYGITKAGLIQLAKNLAVEYGPQNIRANCISPGLIETSFSKEMMKNEGVMERRLSLTPLRRVGQPEEIAGVAVMLASKAGGFITGQNIIVDGGTVISDGN